MSHLRVLLDDDKLCSLNAAADVVEEDPVIMLDDGDSHLRFIDSSGNETSFYLKPLVAGDDQLAYFSIRLTPGYAVQIDVILAPDDSQNPFTGFQEGRNNGVRFQPFLLPEAGEIGDVFKGKGMISRGLHYPGYITPGNLSLLCLCDYCKATFRAQPFHAGMGQSTYLYCSGGPHTLVASLFTVDVITPDGSAEDISAFEQSLPACTACGGSFAYANAFLCPACRQPYIDFKSNPEEREAEYYGNTLYGEQWQSFES